MWQTHAFHRVVDPLVRENRVIHSVANLQVAKMRSVAQTATWERQTTPIKALRHIHFSTLVTYIHEKVLVEYKIKRDSTTAKAICPYLVFE